MSADLVIFAFMGSCGLGLLLCIFMLVRCEVVFHVLTRANHASYLIRDWTLYDAAPSYNAMMWQFHKWTFAQFFPELAAKVKA